MKCLIIFLVCIFSLSAGHRFELASDQNRYRQSSENPFKISVEVSEHQCLNQQMYSDLQLLAWISAQKKLEKKLCNEEKAIQRKFDEQAQERRIAEAFRAQQEARYKRRLVKTVLPQQKKYIDILQQEWQGSDYPVLVKRFEVLQISDFNKVEKRAYRLNKSVKKFIRNQGSVIPYEHFIGNEFQHILHQELLNLFEQTQQFSKCPEEYKECISQVGNLARDANAQGAIILSCRLLDWGWGLLECAKAVVLGVKDGTLNTVDACLHPVKAVQDLACGIIQTGRALAFLAKECGALSYYLAANRQIFHERLANHQEKITDFYEALSQIPKEELIRRATALGVEVVLLNKVITQLCIISKNSLKAAKTWVEVTHNAPEFTAVAHGVPVITTSTTSEYLEFMALQNESLLPKMRGKVGKTSKEVITNWTSLEQELVELQIKFGHQISDIPYRHIFQPDVKTLITKNGQIKKIITGWHHDLKKVIFKSSFFNGYPIEFLNMEKGALGVYQLKWKITEIMKRPKTSTFFPSDWAREKVTKKILEAIKYTERKKVDFILQPSGKNFFATGYTKEGIPLRLVKNQKNRLITVFPEMKK